MLRKLIVVFCLAGPLGGAVRGEILDGVVIGVADGDTITVIDHAKRQHKVRIAGIDAPEKGQPFGAEAKLAMSRLVYDQYVKVSSNKTDRYGRIVGKVHIGGVDAGLAQVDAGLAWHYKAYEREQDPVDREAYRDAEQAAKALKRGLWAHPMATAPWDYRRSPKGSPGGLIDAPPRD